MISETKKYTGKELKELFTKAKEQAITKLSNQMKEAREKTGNDNPIATLMFDVQNMMCIGEVENILFEEASNE